MESNSTSDCQQFKILHVSDIHCAYEKIQQLKEWLHSEAVQVDMVLVSGDIANIPYDDTHTASKELQKEHSDHVQRIVTDFASVCNKVLFIPGNHDPMSWFDTSAPVEDPPVYPLNVHSRKVTVAPKLHLLGFGGSVPAYQDGAELWKGFPFNSDSEFGKSLSEFLDPVLQEEMVSLAETYILMTHVGPTKSNTTELHSPSASMIYAGSDSLYEYLLKVEMQGRTVMNVHGHTHDCTGMATIGSVSVINPGSLMDGHFGLYKLGMVTGRKPAWKLQCASLHRLE